MHLSGQSTILSMNCVYLNYPNNVKNLKNICFVWNVYNVLPGILVNSCDNAAKYKSNRARFASPSIILWALNKTSYIIYHFGNGWFLHQASYYWVQVRRRTGRSYGYWKPELRKYAKTRWLTATQEWWNAWDDGGNGFRWPII